MMGKKARKSLRTIISNNLFVMAEAGTSNPVWSELDQIAEEDGRPAEHILNAAP